MNKFDSRKYALAFYTIIAATAMTFLPPILTFWFREQPLVLMGAIEWCSIVSGTLALYFGANVFSKYTLKAPEPKETEQEAQGNLPANEK